MKEAVQGMKKDWKRATNLSLHNKITRRANKDRGRATEKRPSWKLSGHVKEEAWTKESYVRRQRGRQRKKDHLLVINLLPFSL